MPAGAGGIAYHVDYPPSNREHGGEGVRVPTGDGFIILNHPYRIWIPKIEMFVIIFA